MNVDWDLVTKIASPVLGAAAGISINRLVEKRPRLITYLGHVSTFTIKGTNPAVIVNTHSIVIGNFGRLPANNVRVGHNILPPNHQVLPFGVEHDVTTPLGGGSEIHFPKLVSGEQVTISYLYGPEITWDKINGYIKSDEGFARVLRAIPTPQYPHWVRRTLWTFIGLGAATAAYFVISLSLRVALLLFP